jgi:hypothetical protein
MKTKRATSALPRVGGLCPLRQKARAESHTEAMGPQPLSTGPPALPGWP